MERSPQDLMQFIFDEMANERCRLVVEGEVGDVDATWYETSPSSGDFVEVATGHGEAFEEALDDMINAVQQAAASMCSECGGRGRIDYGRKPCGTCDGSGVVAVEG